MPESPKIAIALSRRAGMVKNLVEDLDRLLHPGRAYPTLRTYGADSLLGRQIKKFRRRGVSV
jgi:hypothetical protein